MIFEGMTKKRWLSLILVVLAVTVIRVMLQPLIPEGENRLLTVHSAIYDAGLLIPAFIVYAFVTAFSLALVFVSVERRMPGTRLMKGIAFGLAYGFMWAIYLLEPVTDLSNMPFLVAYAYPIVDGITFGALGLLLGIFVGTGSRAAKLRIDPSTLALLAIPLAFVAVRYLAYATGAIISVFDSRPFATMLWAAGTGLWISVMYFLLRPGIPAQSPSGKALSFGMLAFGVNLLFFNYFVGLVFEINLADMLLRTVIDIVSVTLGVYACEKISPVSGSIRNSSASEAGQ